VASAQQSSANKEASTHVHVLEAKVHELSQEREKMVKKFQTLKIDLNKKSRFVTSRLSFTLIFSDV